MAKNWTVIHEYGIDTLIGQFEDDGHSINFDQGLLTFIHLEAIRRNENELHYNGWPFMVPQLVVLRENLWETYISQRKWFPGDDVQNIFRTYRFKVACLFGKTLIKPSKTELIWLFVNPRSG